MPKFFIHSSESKVETYERISHDLIYGSQALIFVVVGNSIMLVTDTLSFLAIIGFLLVASPLVGCLTLLTYTSVAFLVVRKLGSESRKLSHQTSNAVVLLQKRIRELLGIQKELILADNLPLIGKLSDSPINTFTNTNARLQRMPIKTKFIMENVLILASTMVAGITLLFQDLRSALGSAALFLIVSLRIVPNLIKIQNALLGLKRAQELSTGLIGSFNSFNVIPAHYHNWKKVRIKSINTGIILKDLQYSIEKSSVPLYNSLSYEFNQGKVYLIRGKSGAGKSTLLELIMGFRAPDSGSIDYYSTGAFDYNISYVPQFPTILNLSIGDNITLTKEVKSSKSLDQLLEELRLSKLAKEYAVKKEGIGSASRKNMNSLSGGEKQRISIARALYYESEVLLMDEPTSALGQEDIHHLERLIENTRSNKIIIIVSHDEALLSWADSVLEI